MARRTNFDKSSVSRFESGARAPVRVKALVQAYAELVPAEDTPSSPPQPNPHRRIVAGVIYSYISAELIALFVIGTRQQATAWRDIHALALVTELLICLLALALAAVTERGRLFQAHLIGAATVFLAAAIQQTDEYHQNVDPELILGMVGANIILVTTARRDETRERQKPPTW